MLLLRVNFGLNYHILLLYSRYMYACVSVIVVVVNIAYLKNKIFICDLKSSNFRELFSYFSSDYFSKAHETEIPPSSVCYF